MLYNYITFVKTFFTKKELLFRGFFLFEEKIKFDKNIKIRATEEGKSIKEFIIDLIKKELEKSE